MKYFYFAIGMYFLIGIIGNYFEIGGSWVNTNTTISKKHGRYKDFYPIHDILYSGYNDSNKLVVCIKGRPFDVNAFNNIPPSRIKYYQEYRPTNYAVVLNKSEISSPDKHLIPVYFISRYYPDPDKVSKSRYVFTYTQKNILTKCPQIEQLKNSHKFAAEYIKNISSWSIANLFPNNTRESPDNMHLSDLNIKQPLNNKNNVDLLLPIAGSGPPSLYINQEFIKFSTIYGGIHYILINNNDIPIIFAGGYVEYKDTGIGNMEVIVSVVVDILKQPINMIKDFILLLLPWG